MNGPCSPDVFELKKKLVKIIESHAAKNPQAACLNLSLQTRKCKELRPNSGYDTEESEILLLDRNSIRVRLIINHDCQMRKRHIYWQALHIRL